MLLEIKSLKQKQDEMEKRKKRLLENFIVFRESFLNYLENFISEAIKSGMKGVNPLDKSNSSAELIAIFATVNSVSFTILSTNETLFNDSESDDLSSKIFFYGEKSGTPIIVVTFQESSENKDIYFAKWSSPEGFKWLIGNSVVVNPMISGQEAANKLLNHFYSYSSYWNEDPNYNNFDERSLRKNFGFVK